MQMKNERAENGEDALSVGVRDAHPEHRFPDLGVDDAFLDCSYVHVLTLSRYRVVTLSITRQRDHATTSYLDERLRVRPLAPFLVELLRLIDDDLAVGHIDVDLRTLQRTRCRSLEVHTRLVVAA